jgi:small-conductance mechanosensitive channel
MVLYTCIKCKKEFTKKSGYDRHNLRKKVCIVVEENIDEKNLIQKKDNISNLPFIENIQEQIKNNDEKVLYNILDQLKHFNEQFCELNKKIETLEESNIELTKCNTELTKSNAEINNKLLALTPTTTQINVINNVTINITPFGKENLNFITEEKCIKELIYSGFGCIQKYIDIVHFNKDKPEYHNMYIPRKIF